LLYKSIHRVFREVAMLKLIKLRILFKTLGRDLAVLFYACRDRATPSWIRYAALAMLIYVISPVDFLPDVMPLLGLADDFALVALGVPWLLRKLPESVRQQANGQAERRFGPAPTR
jgi:uncharacterized membrane protein YkvA (DUF1232 family)